MGANAALVGDKIVAFCPIHQLIGPLGAPLPTPLLPFSAAIATGCSKKTTINGKPIVLVGATGLNQPPHVGLHASDPNAVPLTQIGSVTASPALTLVEGLAVVVSGATCAVCAEAPGAIVGSSNVLVG
jgi:uncharacterized Zn-binding protein involved in type VI secretion